MPTFTLDLTLRSANHLVLRLHDEDHARHVAAHDIPLQPDALLPADPTHLLGPITPHLATGVHHRTLLIRLPDPAAHPLSAALAALPWERPFRAHNVVVRIALSSGPAATTTIAPPPNDPLRVLLVFAETPDARPLAARLERERILDLFFRDILPTRDVEIDTLAHGVTRSRLVDRIREHGGYHIIHWSGHGQAGTLQIAREYGGVEHLSGAQLRGLFAEAGGFLPEMIFLSACHSGAAHTALALLSAGVKQIVAMRGEVGDTYARRLARRVYRGLLGDKAHHWVDKALDLARAELARDVKRAAEYQPSDHEMPVVFGAGSLRFEPRKRRSKQMDRRIPRPQPLDKPAAFVGRGEALSKLGRVWIAPEGTPVALVLGPAGIGKTTLAAEAVHLWFGGFDHVLCFQAPSMDDFLKRTDEMLGHASGAYRERCAENEMAHVYLPPKTALRQETVHDNLVDVLRTERILLVLDGFDKNLLTVSPTAGDPAWDRLLGVLTDRLRDTGSRLLVTSRRRPAALDPAQTVEVTLDRFRSAETAVFLEADPALRALCRDTDLAERLRSAARGHPAVLACFAEIARRESLEAAALVALEDEIDKLVAKDDEPFP